jgi:hypothetical protein
MKKHYQFYLTPQEILSKGYLYVAYGSNLDLDQMRYRTPSAEPIATMELPNWQLVFNGVADIIPKDGASVPLGVFEMNSVEDWEALHAYEGTRPKDAMYYLTEIETEHGTALTYTMSGGRNVYAPSGHYYDTIERGYSHFGMDDAPLKDARKRSERATPRVTRKRNTWYSEYLNGNSPRRVMRGLKRVV